MHRPRKQFKNIVCKVVLWTFLLNSLEAFSCLQDKVKSPHSGHWSPLQYIRHPVSSLLGSIHCSYLPMSCPLHRMPFSILSQSSAFYSRSGSNLSPWCRLTNCPIVHSSIDSTICVLVLFFLFLCVLLSVSLSGTDVLSLSFYHINIECPLLCIALDVGDNTGGQDRHEPCFREDHFWERREFSLQPWKSLCSC